MPELQTPIGSKQAFGPRPDSLKALLAAVEGRLRPNFVDEVGFWLRRCLYIDMETSTTVEPLFATPPLAGTDAADARIAALYRTHYRQLAGLAAMLSGGLSIGEEIAQETFVIALQHERRNPGYLTDPAWPWLRITAARLAGRLRQRLLHQTLPHFLQDRDAASSQAWSGESIDLLRALSHLPTRMRVCVVLAYLEDQSTASIATMLGCSTKNVELRLREGRRRLRTSLGEQYNTK